MLEKIKVFAVIFVIFVIAMMVMVIVLAVKKRKRFKAFLAEQLVDHLDDALYPDRFDDWREKRIDVYLYGCLAKYAEQAAFESIPKRKRFDKEGQYTELSQKKIAENMHMILELFTKQEGFYFNDEFQYFITEYRPYYLVGDFEKAIVEFFSFRTNPDLFEKPVIPEDEPEEEQAEDMPSQSAFAQQSDILSDEPEEVEEVPAEPVKNYDPYYNPYKNAVVHFSTTVTVDHSIMNELQIYTDKLAKKTCEKKGITETDAYGNKTQEYQDLCRNNYNKLCKLFFSEMRFKPEFVEWVNESHSNMDDVTLFGELIPMYIRHIKGKE